jgi:cell filamentation protein
MNSQEREYLEGKFTALRIWELHSNPVQGNFDAVHLKEINRCIFQDFPGLGFSDITPGKFRPPVPSGLDWIKNRVLESIDASSLVAYSRMDSAAQKQLDKILRQANPTQLGKLKTADFTKAMGKLYTEADYIHPFKEGNSRTLREFTRQLALESGYEIDWERFKRQAAGRDILYIARDLSVNELALPHIQDSGTRREVMYTMDIFGRNRNLPELLRDAIRPTDASR